MKRIVFDPEWVFKSFEAIPNVWLFPEPIHGCMASTVLSYGYVFGLPPFQISVNRNLIIPVNRVHLHSACFLPAKCRDARVYNLMTPTASHGMSTYTPYAQSCFIVAQKFMCCALLFSRPCFVFAWTGSLPDHHRSARVFVPQHQDHRRVPRR